MKKHGPVWPKECSESRRVCHECGRRIYMVGRGGWRHMKLYRQRVLDGGQPPAEAIGRALEGSG